MVRDRPSTRSCSKTESSSNKDGIGTDESASQSSWVRNGKSGRGRVRDGNGAEGGWSTHSGDLAPCTPPQKISAVNDEEDKKVYSSDDAGDALKDTPQESTHSSKATTRLTKTSARPPPNKAEGTMEATGSGTYRGRHPEVNDGNAGLPYSSRATNKIVASHECIDLTS